MKTTNDTVDLQQKYHRIGYIDGWSDALQVIKKLLALYSEGDNEQSKTIAIDKQE